MGVGHKRTVDKDVGLVLVFQVSRQFPEVDKPGEGDDETPFPGVDRDHEIFFNLSFGGNGMAKFEDPIICCGHQGDGIDPVLPQFLAEPAHDR